MQDALSVLVTGGAGYVGSHCCKRLAAAGYRPVVFDDLSTGHREFVRWGDLIEGDIRDEDALMGALRAVRPCAVMHFAARALVAESVANPGLYWSVNLAGVLCLLNAMRETGVDKLVFSSTCAIYGAVAGNPISEDHAKLPVNPYGATKWAAEQVMDQYSRLHGIRSLRLRYFNASGASDDGEIGEDHDPETHLIPRVLDAALGRSDAVDILGRDYPTPDGTALRDYVHVLDLAEAHLAALRRLNDGGATDAVNLGTGMGTSVLDIVEAAGRVAGHAVPTRDGPRRAGDPPELVADPSRAHRLLDWRAKRSDIDTIMADALCWHRHRFIDG